METTAATVPPADPDTFPRYLCFTCPERFMSVADRDAHARSVGHPMTAGERILARAFPEAQRILAQVDNGFGGTTTRRVDAPAPAADLKAACATLREMLAARAGRRVAEAIRAEANTARTAGTLTAAKVARWIGSLEKVPCAVADVPSAAPQVAAAPAPQVPAGHYAIPGADGTLRFYRVDTPTDGRWAGRTFVSVQASDEHYPVRGAAAAAVLAEIAADPEAGVRYGREIGRCCRCNRTLTNETSRAAGIGPECAARAAA